MAKEMSVFINDVDTIVVIVRRQDLNLAVCSDAAWMKFSHISIRSTSVGKSESPGLIDHHYSTGLDVVHADIFISVLADVFSAMVRCINRFSVFVVLNTLFFLLTQSIARPLFVYNYH